MASTSIANISNILKTLWPQDRVFNEVYPDHPFLMRLPKATNFVGDSLTSPFATAMGRAAACRSWPPRPPRARRSTRAST